LTHFQHPVFFIRGARPAVDEGSDVALLQIDAQESYKSTYGDSVHHMRIMRRLFQDMGRPIYTKSYFDPDGSSAAGRFAGHHGSVAEPVQTLYDQHGHLGPMVTSSRRPIEGLGPSSPAEFSNSVLLSTLTGLCPHFCADLKEKGVKKLYITGGWTEYCIAATALHAWSLGFDVVLLSQAIAGGDSRWGTGTMDLLDDLHFTIEQDISDDNSLQTLASSMLHLSEENSPREVHTHNHTKKKAWHTHAHWDLYGIWFYEVAAHRTKHTVLYKLWRDDVSAALLVVGTCESASVMSFFTRKSWSVYLLGWEGETCSTEEEVERVEDFSDSFFDKLRATGVGTVFLMGNLADSSLAFAAYRAFDLNFDVVLIQDLLVWNEHGLHDHSKKRNAIQVLRHSVAFSSPADDVITALSKGPSRFHDGYVGWCGKTKALWKSSPSRHTHLHSLQECLDMCTHDHRCFGGEWQPGEAHGACFVSTSSLTYTGQKIEKIHSVYDCTSSQIIGFAKYIGKTTKEDFYNFDL